MKWLFILIPAAFWQAPGEEWISGPMRLVLPEIIYAVPGIETNVYFDSVVLVVNSRNYTFDVECEKGFLLDERWSYTPDEADIGSHSFVLEVRDDSSLVVARAASTLRVVPATAGVGLERTILMIGDSLTQASVYPEHVFKLSRSDGNPRLRMIGSRGAGNQPATGDIRHEGYSGWTAEAFATLLGPLSRSGYFKPPETGSPFVYPGEEGQPELDFERYCAEFNEGRAPDFVTVFLGINDVFSATDKTLEPRIDRMLDFYDLLIENIHEFQAETQIGVVQVPAPASSQYGFRNYRGASRQTYWQYRRNQHRLVERMNERYGGREREQIYLIPVFSSVDTVHGYPQQAVAWNAHTIETETRISDSIHPSLGGYRQIGDGMFCWLKARLAASFASQ